MSYNIRLNVFEGPLDLLLFFIKRDEINIYDIPIAYITQEYLDYLKVMKQMNLQLAGEFILMASLLMRIKAQMLLPRDEAEQGEEIEDPRSELVQMLLEYQRFKEASEQLKALASQQSKYFPVMVSNPQLRIDPDIFLSDINLIDLGLAFKGLIDRLPKPKYYEVERFRVNINQQRQAIRSLFSNRKRIRFTQLAKSLQHRIEVVVTFLAILEMAKSGEISVSQRDVYGEIYLTKRELKKSGIIGNA